MFPQTACWQVARFSLLVAREVNEKEDDRDDDDVDVVPVSLFSLPVSLFQFAVRSAIVPSHIDTNSSTLDPRPLHKSSRAGHWL